MATAFVFMNIDPGTEIAVLKILREVQEVKEAYFVYGVYDVVTKVQADSMGRLKEVILKIRKLDKIRSTLTTIISEDE
ncbi:MAG TPA: Lrp/AsnC ligand binding domain-containing protein [Candidatus Acidoferrum sp.]|nr:Lrp/AsnC ligand binding domain-containing protein [Candidatus Acidoferrum sp.]